MHLTKKEKKGGERKKKNTFKPFKPCSGQGLVCRIYQQHSKLNTK